MRLAAFPKCLIGVGWYRRHYVVPAQYAGRKMFLQFDAADKVADVYVNGMLDVGC